MKPMGSHMIISTQNKNKKTDVFEEKSLTSAFPIVMLKHDKNCETVIFKIRIVNIDRGTTDLGYQDQFSNQLD